MPSAGGQSLQGLASCFVIRYSDPGMRLDLDFVGKALTTAWAGRRFVYVTETGSTQDLARAEAEAGAPAGTVVIAETQTAGRGRFGRRWVSPPGQNLYLTMITRPLVERLRLLSIVAPLAVTLAVEDVAGLRPRIKWPNDVLAGDRKLAGILIESEIAGPEVKYALVGIGLNVNFDIDPGSEIADIATSLKREVGHEVSRERLLLALLSRFERSYEAAAHGPEVHVAWRARLETLGRQVRVTFRDQVYEGLAEDVDAEGNLVLLRPDGSRLTMEAGEVTLRG